MTHTIVRFSIAQTNFKETAVNTIPTPPKIRPTFVNWEKKFFPIIDNIILYTSSNNTKNTKKLLINALENTSNHNFNIDQATSTLIQMLHAKNNNFIKITSYTTYTQVYNNLKLFNNHLTSRSISIKLARHINANYVLYSTIYDNLSNINLEMQLIFVQNGEIIWSSVIPLLKNKKNV